MIRIIAILAALTSLVAFACSPALPGSPTLQFRGSDAPLQQAIEADNPVEVAAAIAGGASPNAVGANGVTPLQYAIGTFRKQSARELIRQGADANRKGEQGDTAVTLAVIGYARDPELLAIALDGGGDPDARFPNGSPVITRFCSDRNLAAITYLHMQGADIDAEDDASHWSSSMPTRSTGTWFGV